MSPTAQQRTPSSKMTNAATVFLAVAAVLGMIVGADTYTLGAGIAMLILVGIDYFRPH